MADPMSLLVADAAARAVEFVGLPEAQLNLSQAVIHLATAPKSNSATTAIFSAREDVRAGKGRAVPSHLRDAHYGGAKSLGHGAGYRYPHNHDGGWVEQRYLPDDLVDTSYYQPTGHGFEEQVRSRLSALAESGWNEPGESGPAESGSGEGQ